MIAAHDALPPGWARAPLSEVADLSLGKMLDRAKRTAGTSMPYLRNINVRWHGFDLSDVYEMPFEPHEIERYSAREGDVMICEGGEPGRAAVWQGPAIMFQKAIHRVRPRADTFDPRWLVWHLRHDAATGRLAESFTGTTIKHLTGSALARYEIAIPPLAEQRRIVAKLDELLASSRAARAALDAVPALLEQYRQAVLAAAFSGALTASWRNASNPDENASATYIGLPAGWSIQPASAFCSVIANGSTPKADRMTPGVGDVPFIKVYNLTRNGSLDFTVNPTYIDRATHESLLKRSRAVPGDVLMNIVGPPLGKVSVISNDYPEWNYNQAIVGFRVAQPHSNEYLSYYLQSPYLELWAIRNSKATAGQFNIAVTACRELPVPLAPPEEQREIVRTISASLGAISRQASAVEDARQRMRDLEQALLARAFRGELTAQDPSDEPASALIERLRTTPVTAPSGRRTRRTPTPA